MANTQEATHRQPKSVNRRLMKMSGRFIRTVTLRQLGSPMLHGASLPSLRLPKRTSLRQTPATAEEYSDEMSDSADERLSVGSNHMSELQDLQSKSSRSSQEENRLRELKEVLGTTHQHLDHTRSAASVMQSAVEEVKKPQVLTLEKWIFKSKHRPKQYREKQTLNAFQASASCLYENGLIINGVMDNQSKKNISAWAQQQINIPASSVEDGGPMVPEGAVEVFSKESLLSFPVDTVLKSLGSHINKHFGIKSEDLGIVKSQVTAILSPRLAHQKTVSRRVTSDLLCLSAPPSPWPAHEEAVRVYYSLFVGEKEYNFLQFHGSRPVRSLQNPIKDDTFNKVRIPQHCSLLSWSNHPAELVMPTETSEVECKEEEEEEDDAEPGSPRKFYGNFDLSVPPEATDYLVVVIDLFNPKAKSVSFGSVDLTEHEIIADDRFPAIPFMLGSERGSSDQHSVDEFEEKKAQRRREKDALSPRTPGTRRKKDHECLISLETRQAMVEEGRVHKLSDVHGVEQIDQEELKLAEKLSSFSAEEADAKDLLGKLGETEIEDE